MKFQPLLPAFVLWMGAGIQAANAAEPLLDAIQQQVESDRASAAAQKSIDQLSDQSRRLLEEYREALRQTEVLNAYNAHLRRLVDSQEAEKQSLEKQFKDIEITRRDLIPLMLRMQETLDRFVQLDRPFLAEERARRVADLQELMNRADVSDAEKFRRLLEAYRIENEYGKTIEAYRAELKDGGASVRTVDFLRIGRIGLFYRSLDGRETGAWNNRTRQWEKLPANDRDAIGKGLAIARKESPPELLPIAVEPPEAAR
jgi:hypothetical protein